MEAASKMSPLTVDRFCQAARCWGASQVNLAQQRLYFWPEPQGHWAFRPGTGGALTVLQCEPNEEGSPFTVVRSPFTTWAADSVGVACTSGC